MLFYNLRNPEVVKSFQTNMAAAIPTQPLLPLTNFYKLTS
jgi:hypothetical protein